MDDAEVIDTGGDENQAFEKNVFSGSADQVVLSDKQINYVDGKVTEESQQQEKTAADSESIVSDNGSLQKSSESSQKPIEEEMSCGINGKKSPATEIGIERKLEESSKIVEDINRGKKEMEDSNTGSFANQQTEAFEEGNEKDGCITSSAVTKEVMTVKDIPVPDNDKYDESLTELKCIFEHKNEESSKLQNEEENNKEMECSKDNKTSYENQFEQFLLQTKEREDSNNDSSNSNKIKGPTKTNDAFKPISEETSNSSWYKINSSEQPMFLADTTQQDEASNLSAADNTSVVSSNIGDSCLSYQDQASNMDECSNLSAPEDSVPPYTGHAPVFDESANMNPPSNVTFIRPDTPNSIINDTMSESTPAKKTRRGTLQIAAEDASEHGHNITAADIFEYQWPAEAETDLYILQEQISIFLDIKSFKRKYPDLFRRVCDKHEKDFLREKGVVSETQSDLGLTALKSEEVHDLMSKDYPAKYKEYLKVLHEKERQRMADKMKEHDALKLEKNKMIAYTKKAMKSASDWNRNMLKERGEKRRAYFDMQTFSIQYPKSKFCKLENVKTAVSAYPLSLIPGQFQDYYRKYSSEELKYFPLNTTLFDPPKKVDIMARHRQLQQMEDETESQTDQLGGSQSDSEGEDSSSSSEESTKETRENTVSSTRKNKSSSRETSHEKSVEMLGMSAMQPVVKLELMECRICKDDKGKSKQKLDQEMIRCSECKGSGHPSCLDLTDEMVKIIKTYPWQCMECKTCVECMDPYDEDKMLFCDKCDRGYHTFCVGLKSLPTGQWECKSCQGDSTPVKPIPRPTPKSKRARKTNGKSTPKPDDSASKDKQSKAPPVKEKGNSRSGKETPVKELRQRSLKEKSLSKDNLKSMMRESSRSSFRDRESSRSSFRDRESSRSSFKDD